MSRVGRPIIQVTCFYTELGLKRKGCVGNDSLNDCTVGLSYMYFALETSSSGSSVYFRTDMYMHSTRAELASRSGSSVYPRPDPAPTPQNNAQTYSTRAEQASPSG